MYVSHVIFVAVHTTTAAPRALIADRVQPANVLLDAEGHARISDLGLARDISKSLPTSEWSALVLSRACLRVPSAHFQELANLGMVPPALFQACALAPGARDTRTTYTHTSTRSRTLPHVHLLCGSTLSYISALSLLLHACPSSRLVFHLSFRGVVPDPRVCIHSYSFPLACI